MNSISLLCLLWQEHLANSLPLALKRSSPAPLRRDVDGRLVVPGEGFAVVELAVEALGANVDRLREAAGETLKTQHIVRALEDRDLLARRHDAKRAAVRWVPK